MSNVKSSHIQELIQGLGQCDFEYTLRHLTVARDVLSRYEKTTAKTTVVRKAIKEDIEKIKNALIQAIADGHPSYPSCIKDEQYNSCFKFLKHFERGRKYTFNYDLLLYWVYMHFKERPEGEKLEMDDGFRSSNSEYTVTWEIGNEIEQNLYYLHGAIHIFNSEAGIEKYTWQNTGIPIKDQVQESLENSKYPIFITEGSKQQKAKRIRESAYLGRSFSSLKSIGGSLFIFGHSLGDGDDHVFDHINKKSKVKKIFVSVYGDIEEPHNKKLIKKVESWEKNYPAKEYFYYDAETAEVWG